jgi:hypothetical protein
VLNEHFGEKNFELQSTFRGTNIQILQANTRSKQDSDSFDEEFKYEVEDTIDE